MNKPKAPRMWLITKFNKPRFLFFNYGFSLGSLIEIEGEPVDEPTWVVETSAFESSRKKIAELKDSFTEALAERDAANKRIVDLEAERDDLSVKLQRTVSAAYHALLEMTAWMGMPEKKRHAQIEEYMSNVKFCAEHDCRQTDESQRNRELASRIAELEKEIEGK
jgi:uncharacterized coiled-coil DUF342 family protein